MTPIVARHPRLIWRSGLLTSPLWLALGGVACHWMLGQPVPAPVQRDASHRGQHASSSVAAPPQIGSYAAVWSRSLRDQLIEPEPEAEDTDTEQDRGLRLTLLGTAVEGRRSFAILRSDQGRVMIAELGSMLDTYLVQAIEADRITLGRDGGTLDLMLPEQMRRLIPDEAKALRARVDRVPEVRAAAGGEPAADRPTLRLRGVSTDRFLSDTRLIPMRSEPGEPTGFRIDSIAKDSPLLRAGIRPGDAIVTVDDEPLTRLQDLQRLYARLDEGVGHRWGMRRGSVEYTVEINYSETRHDEAT